MATLGRSGDEALAARFARALARGAHGGRASRSTTRRCSTSTPIRRTRSSAIARWPSGADVVARLGARHHSRRCRATGVAACGKHFPGHGDTGTDSHLELPLVEHPPDRLRAVEFEPFRAAIEAQVAIIMTAHVFVPALDEERPATLSPRDRAGHVPRGARVRGRHPQRRPRDEGHHRAYRCPRRPSRRLQAGCDGVLICSGDLDTQAATLEALIHAVEDRRDCATRLDDALSGCGGRRSVSCAERPAIRRAHRRALRARARPRRTPGDRGGDGALPVMS